MLASLGQMITGITLCAVFVQCRMKPNLTLEVIKRPSITKAQLMTLLNVDLVSLNYLPRRKNTEISGLEWQNLSTTTAHLKDTALQHREFITNNKSLIHQTSWTKEQNSKIQHLKFIKPSYSADTEKNMLIANRKYFPVHNRSTRFVSIEEYHIGMPESSKVRNLESMEGNTPIKQKPNRLSLEYRFPRKGRLRILKDKHQNRQYTHNYHRRDSTDGKNISSSKERNKPALLKNSPKTMKIILIVAGCIGGLMFIPTITCFLYRLLHRKKSVANKTIGTQTNNYKDEASSDSETSESNEDTYSEEEESISDYEGCESQGIDCAPALTPREYGVRKESQNNNKIKSAPKVRVQTEPYLNTDVGCHGDIGNQNVLQKEANLAMTTLHCNSKNEETLDNPLQQKNIFETNDVKVTIPFKTDDKHSSNSCEGDVDYHSEKSIKDIVRNLSPSIYTTSENQQYSYAKSTIVPSCYYTDCVNYSIPKTNNIQSLGEGDVNKQNNHQTLQSFSRLSEGTAEKKTTKLYPQLKSKPNFDTRYKDFDLVTNEVKPPVKTSYGSSQSSTYDTDLSSLRQPFFNQRIKKEKGVSRRLKGMSTNESNEEFTNTEFTEQDSDTSGGNPNKWKQRNKFIQKQVHVKNKNYKIINEPLIPKSKLSRYKVEEWLRPTRKCASESMFLSTVRHEESYKGEELKPLLS